MPARDLTASRRVALGLAAGGALAALTGCDADTPLPGTGGGDSPTATAPPQDADGRLVDRVRAEVVAVLTAVRAARGRAPLAGAVRSLEALHLAHLRALDGEEPAPPRRAAGTPAQVAQRLAAREERHQQLLARAATRAVSGDLAALLATMTAGVAQHRGLVERS